MIRQSEISAYQASVHGDIALHGRVRRRRLHPRPFRIPNLQLGTQNCNLPPRKSLHLHRRIRRLGAPPRGIRTPSGWRPGIFWRFLDQYTKLRIWTLDRPPTSLKSIIYLNADTLVKRNFDELFDIPFVFSASPDVYLNNRGFSIGFNAGVLAIIPSNLISAFSMT